MNIFKDLAIGYSKRNIEENFSSMLFKNDVFLSELKDIFPSVFEKIMLLDHDYLNNLTCLSVLEKMAELYEEDGSFLNLQKQEDVFIELNNSIELEKNYINNLAGVIKKQNFDPKEDQIINDHLNLIDSVLTVKETPKFLDFDKSISAGIEDNLNITHLNQKQVKNLLIKALSNQKIGSLMEEDLQILELERIEENNNKKKNKI